MGGKVGGVGGLREVVVGEEGGGKVHVPLRGLGPDLRSFDLTWLIREALRCLSLLWPLDWWCAHLLVLPLDLLLVLPLPLLLVLLLPSPVGDVLAPPSAVADLRRFSFAVFRADRRYKRSVAEVTFFSSSVRHRDVITAL